MIWVIGCKGMLGSELCRKLTKNNINFIGTGHEVDITNIDELEKFYKNYETSNYLKGSIDKINWIINCSAYTQVDKAEDEVEQATAVNTTGVLNIARICRNHGVKLIHISTDYVFDGKSQIPYTEKDVKNPTGVYGKTKSEGEDAIISSMTQYYILRTGWLYGFDGKNFVYTISKLCESNDEIRVVSDQKGTPTFCGDLADAMLKIIYKSESATEIIGKHSAPSFGIYNFSNKGETTWFEFANEIQRLALKYKKINHSCKINGCTTEEYGAKAPRPLFSVLNKDKIEKEIGIRIPEWDKSLVAFFKDKKFEIR